MRRLAGISIALSLTLGGPGAAWAQPASGAGVSAAPDKVALTIYRDPSGWDGNDWNRAETSVEPAYDRNVGLALVNEWRTIDLPAGESRIRFQGVAEGIVAQTVAIDGLPARLLEQNQDYDLLSPGSLLSRSIGERVTRVRTNRATGAVTREQAVLRSAPQGVMLEINGRLEALACSGEPERLELEKAPEGLTDKPTLSMRVRADKPGRYKVRLSYLAVGLVWKADYVARVAADGQTLALTGWITLSNRSGTTFADAPTAVVAGRVERDGSTIGSDIDYERAAPRCWPSPSGWNGPVPVQPMPMPAPAPVYLERAGGFGNMEDMIVVTGNIAKQSDVGDFKFYTLPFPTTVAARQTKQVMMIDQPAVVYDRVYLAEMTEEEPDEDEGFTAARVLLKLRNDRAQGLGLPLPAGKVAVMETVTGGALLLAGEGELADTPVGLPAELRLGESADVQIRTVRAETTDAEDEKYNDLAKMEVTLVNGKSVPVTVEYRLSDGHEWRVVSESARHARIPGGVAWTFRLAPGQTKVLKYAADAS